MIVLVTLPTLFLFFKENSLYQITPKSPILDASELLLNRLPVLTLKRQNKKTPHAKRAFELQEISLFLQKGGEIALRPPNRNINQPKVIFKSIADLNYFPI